MFFYYPYLFYKLMKDFHCKNAEDIQSEVLAKRVYELKETQEGVDSMCREMDEIYNRQS